jgi:hypothetical protein
VKHVFAQVRSLFETQRLSLFGQSPYTEHAISVYRTLHDRAQRLAASRGLDFACIYYPIPHTPHIYHPRRSTFDVSNDVFAGYAGNLALSDLTYGGIRRAMERAGLSDASAAIATSDGADIRSRSMARRITACR